MLLLLSPLPVLAQVTIDTLHWSATRRLRLTDFRSPTQPGLGGSDFHYQIGYEVRPTSAWSQLAIESICLMFRDLSWMSETARNDRTLTYNQALFDLVEIHTRQMKAKLIALKNNRRFRQQARQIEYLTNAELGAEVNLFRAETGGGDDTEAVQRWQDRIVKRLYDTPDLVTVYRSSKVGYGFFVGGGGALASGALAQTFNASIGVGAGLDLTFRRTVLLLHASGYRHRLRTGFSYQTQTWEAGLPVNTLLAEAGLGHMVTNTTRTRLIPYVGYRLFDLLPRNRNDERYKELSVSNYAPTVGMALDLKLGDNQPRIDHSEDNFWFVRVKASYSPMLDSKVSSGGLFNIQVGVGGFARMRKVSYRPDPTVLLPR